MARVRKLAQATAFLGPTACLAGAAFCDDGPLTVGKTLVLQGALWLLHRPLLQATVHVQHCMTSILDSK